MEYKCPKCGSDLKQSKYTHTSYRCTNKECKALFDESELDDDYTLILTNNYEDELYKEMESRIGYDPMAIKYVSLSKEDFKMDNTDNYFDLFQYVFEEYNIDIPEEQEESFLIFLKSYNINIEYERIDFGDGKSITKSKINKNDLYQVVILYKIYLKKLKYNLLKELNKKGE